MYPPLTAIFFIRFSANKSRARILGIHNLISILPVQKRLSPVVHRIEQNVYILLFVLRRPC